MSKFKHITEIFSGFSLKKIDEYAALGALGFLLSLKFMDSENVKSVTYNDLVAAIGSGEKYSLVITPDASHIRVFKEGKLVLRSRTPKIASAKDQLWDHVTRSNLPYEIRDFQSLAGFLNEVLFIKPTEGAKRLQSFFSDYDFEHLSHEQTRDLAIILLLGFLGYKTSPFGARQSKNYTFAEPRHEDFDRLVAYHEAGHAITALELNAGIVITKATIVPGEGFGGFVQFDRAKDVLQHQEILINQIAVYLGGMAAEHIIYGHHHTGVTSDINQTTNLARDLVARFGMSEDLGPIKYEQHTVLNRGSLQGFLARFSQQNISDRTLEKIEAEMQGYAKEALKRAKEVLARDNSRMLHALAKALLKEKTLDEDKIKQIINNNRPQQQLDLFPSKA